MSGSRSGALVPTLGRGHDATGRAYQPPGGPRAAAAARAPRQGNLPARTHHQYRSYTFL